MDAAGIEQVLSEAKAASDRGESLAGTGFWRTVARIKTNGELIERYADQVADTDQTAFHNWALVVVPIGIGTGLMTLATLVGTVLIGFAYVFTDLAAVLIFYVGFGVVLTTSHGLAHLIVGRAMGIGFTSWFIGTIGRPQPGVKVDYASYLRTPATRRAWMHASGAIVTKTVPFALVGAAIASGLPWWAVWALPVIGAVTIVTDVLWSTKSSDWKKFSREMAFAHKS